MKFTTVRYRDQDNDVLCTYVLNKSALTILNKKQD